MKPSSDDFARGGVIPDPCACGTPSIVCGCGDTRCPSCDPTCGPPQLQRSWHRTVNAAWKWTGMRAWARKTRMLLAKARQG